MNSAKKRISPTQKLAAQVEDLKEQLFEAERRAEEYRREVHEVRRACQMERENKELVDRFQRERHYANCMTVLLIAAVLFAVYGWIL